MLQFSKRLFPLALLISGVFTAPSSLHSKFDCQKGITSTNSQAFDSQQSIVQECLKLFPFKDPNKSGSIEESHQILDENQNNCALKCINERLNVTSEDGLIDVSKIQQVFLQNQNATKQYVLKLTKLMRECERMAGNELRKDGENYCKYHIMFMHCYSDSFAASREEIIKKVFGVGFLLQILSFQVHSIELSPSWFACKVDFKDKEQKIKVITDCAAKTNYQLPSDGSLESIQTEMKQLSSTNFEDKCFSKCWYESEKLLKDGKIVVADMGNYFKGSNITEPLLKEYTKIITECVAETEPKFKDEKEIPCKMYAMVDHCAFQKFQDHKKHFEEICSKSSK